MNTNGTGLITDNIYMYTYTPQILFAPSLLIQPLLFHTTEYISNKDDIIERELEEITVK
jgi:hypothetical protein